MTDPRAFYAKAPEQRTEALLHVGHQCSSPKCSLVDFLPLKCQHCSEAFCDEHFKPEAHACPKYDASKYDRVAPPCPFCHTPVAIPPGEDPNIRMERHLNKDCSVLTGNSAKKPSVPICGRAKCGKKLFVLIKCDKCYQQFCPEHRYPTTHTCQTPAAPLGSQNGYSNAKSQTSAAMAAFRRGMAPATSAGTSSAQPAARIVPTRPTPTPQVSASASSSSKTTESSGSTLKPNNNPITKAKVDRRAEKERKSRRTAILARKKKGLVSAEEWARFEAEEAEYKNEGKSDCVVM